MVADYYDVLGVDHDADRAELKAAYRALARRHHPDVSDDPNAVDRFRALVDAYRVLSDEVERQAYDRLGHEAYLRHRHGDDSAGDVSTTVATPPAPSASAAAERRPPSPSPRPDARTGPWEPRRDRQWTHAPRERVALDDPLAWTWIDRDDGVTPRTLTWSWLAVAVATLWYLAGLWVFLRASRASLEHFVATLTTAPGAALVGPSPFVDPAAFVAAAGASEPALLFLVGVVLLPVVLGRSVYRFGHGTTWGYVVGAAGPALGLALATVGVGVPAAVALCAFVALPLVGALLFLADLGRVLTVVRAPPAESS